MSAKPYRTREYTCRLLEALEEGLLDKDHVIRALLMYMSESDVKECCISDELIEDSEEESDDE